MERKRKQHLARLAKAQQRLDQAKVMRDGLMLATRDAGATQDEIAVAIGRHRQQVQRWFKTRENGPEAC